MAMQAPARKLTTHQQAVLIQVLLAFPEQRVAIQTSPSAGDAAAYAQNFLPWSVISRPLDGDVPTIDLVIGYSKANTSPILKLFLSRLDELIARVSKKFGGPVDSSEGNAR